MTHLTHRAGRIHVTAAMVRDVMPTGRVHLGVCSGWLHRQQQQQLQEAPCATLTVGDS